MEITRQKNKVAAVIQTTLERNYKNLPSFVLDAINGKTAAEYIHEKLKQIKNIDDVIFAIPDNFENKKLKSFLKEKGIKVYSGAYKDVTQRIVEAGKICDARHIVRVTCEYVLFSPSILEKMIERHLKNGADFTCSENLANGISPEIFSIDALNRLRKEYEGKEFIRPSMMKSKPNIYKIEKFNGRAEGYEKYSDLNLICDSPFKFNIAKKIINIPAKRDIDTYELFRNEIEAEDENIKNLKFNFKKIAIALTDYCNLRCVMCGFPSIPDRFVLSKEKAIEALDFCIDKKVETIEITGGEPFTVKYIDELLDYLISRSQPEEKSSDILITSNGLLINDERIEKLKELKGAIIYISIDGIGGIHDSIRGEKGAYKKAIKTVEKLHERGIRIVINTVVQKKNLHQLFDIYKTFLHISPVWHGFSLIEKITEGAVKNHLERNDLSILLEQASMIVKNRAKGKREPREPLYELFSYLLRIKNEEFMAASGENCSIPLEFLSIRPNGTVLPCWHYCWNFSENLNINKLPLKEIVSSEWYKKEIYNTIKGNCKGCNTLCYAWSDNFMELIKKTVESNPEYLKFKEDFYKLVDKIDVN